MKRLVRPLTAAAALAVCALALVQTAAATLTGGQDIIPAPPSVVDSSGAGGASNTHQQAFNERQVVLLTAAIGVDAGSISAGTLVSSHMIFLNKADTAPGSLTDLNVTWTFSGGVLGVMSNSNGSLEVASSGLLGAPGTTYPALPFPARGLEPGTPDGYAVAGNAITVSMAVSQPGDWIRVVTAAVAADCKNGGWKTSPLGFKNQGDCVSYIATHGGNEPGQNVPTSKE